MDKKDMMKVFALMQELYPRDNSLFVDERKLVSRAEAWADVLNDVPLEDGLQAVRDSAKNSVFSPAIADIVEYHEIYRARRRDREAQRKAREEALRPKKSNMTHEDFQMLRSKVDPNDTLRLQAYDYLEKQLLGEDSSNG